MHDSHRKRGNKTPLRPCCLLVLLAALLLSAVSASAQSTTSGWTPAGVAPGAPAGSYPLSGFENINAYNGHLSGSIPLFSLGGRGEAGYTAALNMTPTSWIIESQWASFEVCYDSENCVTYWYQLNTANPDPNAWVNNPGYGPGVMYFRRSGENIDGNASGYVLYGTHLTRLTFAMPDGTELEFVDQQHEGAVGGYTGDDRGRIWTTRDGSVSATFISDSEVQDFYYYNDGYPEVFAANGDLYLKSGMRYRVEDGLVKWMRDRNGNKVSFDYVGGQITQAVDSLNREITFAYAIDEGYPYGICDKITYKGAGGNARTLRISRTNLGNALRSGYSVQNYHQLFPELYGSTSQTFNPGGVASALWLPDGRSYKFRYNPYEELAQVELPTGGGFQYDYGSGSSSGASIVGDYTYHAYPGSYPPDPVRLGFYRRLQQRRVYQDLANNSLESYTTYSLPTVSGTWLGDSTEVATVTTYDAVGNPLNGSKHYFDGDAARSILYDDIADTVNVRPWKDGREFKTESLDAQGNALRRVENIWAQGQLPGGPRITDTITTLLDTNQVTKQHFDYDSYGNVTLTDEYDFDSGHPGSLVRRTTTEYLATNPVNNSVYDNPYPINLSLPLIHLRGLPKQTSVSDGTTESARTSFEYDNYSGTNHATLQTYPRPGFNELNISGLDAAFNSNSSNLTRGNATAVTRYLLPNGSIATYAQYDVAGNIVKGIDARGHATTFDFSDCFGGPDGEARSNSAPSELSLSQRSSYAFPARVTDALGQTAYTQVDYYLGKVVDSEDANGVVSSAYYIDPLDRPTQLIRGANPGSLIKNQTTIDYNDVDRVVSTTSDQVNYNDNALKSQTVYDRLGRNIESRQYENASQYTAVQKVPFIVLEDPDTNALVTASQSSNPFRPYLSEQPVWTTQFSDALGRPTKVRTPDNAIARTSYSGNTVTVTDQHDSSHAGKSRKSVTDALGRLRQVYEDPANLNYLTSYEYDVLDDLTLVTQQDPVTQLTQTRSFFYDSLKRLSSATNPESGLVSFQYDNNGNLVVKTDNRGVSVHYDYDELNRLFRRWYNSSPLLTATVHNSPVLPSELGTSVEVKYFYDSQGLPNGAPSSASPDLYSRGYATGRLVAVTYGGGSSGDYYGYDEAGRIKPRIQQIGGVNYKVDATYNLSGALTTQKYPSGRTVTNDYDAAGRTTSVVGKLGDNTLRDYSTGIVYSPFGGLAKEQLGTTTPIYNKQFYNVRGQLAEIRAGTTYTGPSDTSWNRGAVINDYCDHCAGAWYPPTEGMPDNNGNLKSQDYLIPKEDVPQPNSFELAAQQFEYDALNRIQRVHEGDSWQQTYSYDRFGNRTINVNNTSAIFSPKTFEVETGTNRLLGPGDSGLTGSNINQRLMQYDAVGNLKSDTHTGAGQRIYDAENRMTRAWGRNNQWQEYTYSGDGQRVKRKVDGVETWQIYGLGGELIAEYASGAAAASPQKEYGYRNGQLLVTATVTTAWGPPPTYTPPDPLVAGVEIKLEHLTELRAAVNQLRAHAGLLAFTFTVDPNPERNVTFVKADHILQLRAALEEARWHLGLSTGGYEHPNLHTGDWIYAKDFQELRDQVLSAWNTGTGGVEIRWLVSDQLGTPRMIFDQAGSFANVVRHDYLPFGEELFAAGRTTNNGYTNNDGARQKFTQQERDIETGLDYFEARYYSSAMGRFASADYIEGNPSAFFRGFDISNALPYSSLLNPQTLNGYSYVSNNPLTSVDPSGHVGARIAVLDSAGKKTGYTMRVEGGEYDSPNIHVFNRRGREVGRFSLKPGEVGFTNAKSLPANIQQNVREYAAAKWGEQNVATGVPGRAYEESFNARRAAEAVETDEEASVAARGPRGGRGNNALTALLILQLGVDIFSQYSDDKHFGYHYDFFGNLVVTNLELASQHLPRGQRIEYNGVQFIWTGKIWFDPICHSRLVPGKNGGPPTIVGGC